MSSPEHQTDQQIDELLAGKSITDHSGILQELVDHYRADSLPPHLERRILQKAELMTDKPKRKVKQSPWIGRLVAGLVLTIGLFGAYSFGTYNETQVASPVEVAPTEIVLDTVEPLFSDTPDILPDFGFEYGGFTTINDNDTVSAGDLMQDAGMQWVGIHVNYDIWDSISDPIVEQIFMAHQEGFKVLVSVSPRFGDMDAVPDSFTSRYARFLREVAYGGADAIEIWPGANIARSEAEQSFLMAWNYDIVLDEASRAIRAANPDTLIISGAPAPTGAESAFQGQVINDDNFLEQVFELGGLDSVDCVGMQFNEGTVPPLATEGDLRDDYYTRYLPTMLQRYRQVVDAEIPICVTSLGYFSSEGVDPIPEFYAWGENTSREEQQQWISEAIDWLSYQSDVPLAMIWHIDHSYPYIDPDRNNDPIAFSYSLMYPRD